MSEKQRLDVAVFERGFAETREKAKAMIMAGSVCYPRLCFLSRG